MTTTATNKVGRRLPHLLKEAGVICDGGLWRVPTAKVKRWQKILTLNCTYESVVTLHLARDEA